MNNILKTKIPCLLLCLVMLGCTLAGCSRSKNSPNTLPETETKVPQTSTETPGNEDTALNDNLRSEYETKLAEIKEIYNKNPNEQDIALQYSQILHALGDFDESQKVLAPYLDTENPSPDVVSLSAELEYLKGTYTEAERLYKMLEKEHNEEYGLAAEAGLQMVYYQTNEYSKASELFIGQDFDNPLLDMMKAFGDTTPYQIEWNGNEQTAIPFVTIDPLAIVPIEINGVKMNAFIDTGGTTIMIDEAIAEELGIETISNNSGTVAGGTIDYLFGKTNSMKLGDVDIKNIPVTLLSFEGISDALEEYATDIHAIIGTNVLQQFKSIMDFPSGQLILMPRNETGETQLSDMLANDNVLEEVPFTLASSHLMYAKGSVNGHEGLNMFVDSGGGDENGAGIFFIKETMNYLKIPIPEMESATGVGPDAFEEGWFDLSSYGLGNLQVKQGVGKYDTSGHSDDLTDITGFVHDALINHNYLRQYKWILDFDAMTMIFCE